LILALLLVTGPIAAFTPQVHAVTASVTAELTAISPLTDIDASLYNLETPPTPSPVGGQFTVEIHLRDAANVQGVEVRLDFTAILAHAHNVSFVDKLGAVGGVLNSPVLEAVAAGFYDAGVYKVAAASTGAAWTQADGLIAILTFAIDSQPSGALYEPDFVGALHFTFTDVSDPVPAPIDHVNVDGQLKIDASPFGYPPSPYIFVSPVSNIGTLGVPFTVSIMISADPFWDVAGFDVTFTYDPTLLSVVAVNEGNFLKQHGEATYGWTDTTTPGLVWAVFAKLSDATPSGGVDSLYTVTLLPIFESTSYPPLSCTLGLINTDLASWAHPERTTLEPWMGRITAVQLPYDPLDTNPWNHYTINGLYTSPLKISGPYIDLYTQYPDPYGGQGLNEHSDAFAPQQLVCLYAKVTYGGDRVTNKLVTFQVNDAQGHKVTILENYTDINGIAKVCFRIPQTDMIPGGEDPAIFGWWTVNSTVELDQVVVMDNLTFQVGWLVEVDSVTANPASYAKYGGVPMTFDVLWHTIREQPIWALLTVDPFDSQMYPIGEAYWGGWFNATRIGGNPGTTIYGDYSTTVMIGIPTWARVGLGTVYAVALTDFPIYGGTAYCPYATNSFGITYP
jgi:hypothetical protein